jgi:nucleoside-diphosphate-sugar epimerase
LINQIGISGATGWLGREVIAKLAFNLPLEMLSLFSSDGREFKRNGHIPIPTQTFLTAVPPESLEGYIHLAFVIRDKVPRYGYSEFVASNISLISKACQIIEISKPKWIVLVSSGAVFDPTTNDLETDSLRNPYGFCKRIEENLVLESAKKVGANVVIGRLWGATGEFMIPNSAYAISDFIQSAFTEGKIKIRSGGSVFRRYVDAGEFMQTLVNTAIAGGHLTVNSGGPKVEIGQLASMISEHFSSVEIVRPANDGLVDSYYPKDDQFEKLSLEAGVKISDLSAQVSRTVKGHMTAFSD